MPVARMIAQFGTQHPLHQRLLELPQQPAATEQVFRPLAALQQLVQNLVVDCLPHGPRRPFFSAWTGGRLHRKPDTLRHRPLTPDEVARNRSLVPIRAGIERTYGTLKRRYGWVRVRYRGLASNAAHLDLLCLALNLRRLDVLTRRDGRGSPPRLRTASWWPRADVSPCFSSTGCWNPDHRRGTGDEAKQVCRRADHRGAARA